jgi:aspartate aminotransferase
LNGQPISSRITDLYGRLAPLISFFTESTWSHRQGQPGISDFVAGNPQEPPLPAFVETLQKWAVPQRNDWFAYRPNDDDARATVAAVLRERRGLPFEPEDVFMTTGAFGALATAFRAIADPGDEIVYVSPPWFFYDAMIRFAGADPVRVNSRAPEFDLPVNAIEAAITPRTRAVIVNSPHNPTGRIYPAAALQDLARVMTAASARAGRPIYLISDEAYSRILFDGRAFLSPTAFYAHTLLVYTFGKVLLTPGQRLGYLALAPGMPDKEQVRGAVFLSQIAAGFAFPNAVLQFAVGDLEELTIDIEHLQRKRDRMVPALREMGYELHVPEGTFYLLPRSPIPDDLAFTELLANNDVFVLPGSLFELPGYFRISLTGSDEMIDRALPVFASAMQEALSPLSAPRS